MHCTWEEAGLETGGGDIATLVVISENEGECSICLDEWSVGEMASELPCKHKYHFRCLKKWLSINSTCPQYRYELPL